MKSIAIALLAVSASLYAQQTSTGPNSPNIKNVNGDVNLTPAQKAQAAHQAQQQAGRPPQAPPAPAPQATPVEPKHSEAVANLRAVEAEKAVLLGQQQNLINQVNTMIGSIREKIAAKEKEAVENEKTIREENGWSDDVQYVAPQQMPDGSTSPGKWQKAVKK